MAYAKKIVLHFRSGYRPELDKLIEEFKRDGVMFVGVVGEDASRVEDIIDELCVGDGSNPYEMLTSSHAGESLDQAVEFARSIGLEYAGEIQVVEF